MVIRMMISGDDYHLILAATPVVCVVYLVKLVIGHLQDITKNFAQALKIQHDD